MLFLLRQIRRKLMNESKFTTYLLYAIGEIILVVVGILIAVSIDNWNANRKSKAEEKILLTKLLQEQISDKENLEEVISLHIWLNNKLDTLQALIFHSDEIDLDSIRQADFDSYIGFLYYIPSYKPKQAFMNSAINSGQISLVANDSISTIIAGWSGLYEDYQGSIHAVYDLVTFQIVPYLSGKHPFSNTTKEFEIVKKSFGSKFTYDRVALLDDLKMESLTELKRVDAEGALEKAEQLLDLKEALINLLKNEIKKHN